MTEFQDALDKVISTNLTSIIKEVSVNHTELFFPSLRDRKLLFCSDYVMLYVSVMLINFAYCGLFALSSISVSYTLFDKLE